MYSLLCAERLSRLLSIAALDFSVTEVPQRSSSEKSSVGKVRPMPGRISGVGAWVRNAAGDGVADGGNQMMVGVGDGVAVQLTGVGVALRLSIKAHELPIPAIKVRIKMRKNIMRVW